MVKTVIIILILVVFTTEIVNSTPTIVIQHHHRGLWRSPLWNNIKKVATTVLTRSSALTSHRANEIDLRQYEDWNMLTIGQKILETLFNIFAQYLETIWPNLFGTPISQAFMNTRELVEFHGYSVEEHKVETADGYTLTLFRILRDKNNIKVEGEKGPRPTVLQHGVLCASDDWLHLEAESLPFLLANEGHDVWLSNFRGNNYSMKHERLRSNDLNFWDFSMDELGQYDVPAIINYILKETEWDSLNWIGHSMGCATLFIAIDIDPSLNDKVHKMVALAPAVYVKYLKSPIFKAFSYLTSTAIRTIGDKYAEGRFMPSRLQGWLRRVGPYFCSGQWTINWCKYSIFQFAGHNPEQLSDKTTRILAGHTPSEASIKTLAHYGQYVNLGKFAAYDYGPDENLKRYNTSTPYYYNLANVKVPVLAIYGMNDYLTPAEDVKKTISQLGNIKESFAVDNPRWTHLDFLCGVDAKKLIYEPIIKFLSISSST